MKLLIDTNIIIDFLELRDDSEAAKKLLKLAEDSSQYECVSSSSVTDILFILTKAMLHRNKDYPDDRKMTRNQVKEQARDNVEKLLSILHILPVTEHTIKIAFALKWRDTEDALQYSVSKENNVDVIITNNKKDFEKDDIPLMTAQEFLDTLSNSN